MPSFRDSQPTLTPWVEREFPDTLDVVRWDAGFDMDAGYTWDQELGVRWNERTFKEATSRLKPAVWSRR